MKAAEEISVPSAEAPGSAWKRFERTLFENGGADAVFAHTRNLVMSTAILAAGTLAVDHSEHLEIPSVLNLSLVGYGVAGIGVGLFALNVWDGLRKLSKAKRHTVLQGLLLLSYVFIAVRLAQLLIHLKTSK